MTEIKVNIPDNIQLRSSYIERIKPFIGQHIIKVLTGQRRVGKSYLLFQIIQLVKEQDNQATMLYINKEDLAFSFLKTADDLNKYVLAHKALTGKTYVFIDEIQTLKTLEMPFVRWSCKPILISIVQEVMPIYYRAI